MITANSKNTRAGKKNTHFSLNFIINKNKINEFFFNNN